MAALYYNREVTGTLTIRLDEELAQSLREAARQSGLSKGEIVRQAIEARLKRGHKRSVIQRYFGVVQGPKDLSTNKKYRRKWSRESR
jgi:hypothetical protein